MGMAGFRLGQLTENLLSFPLLKDLATASETIYGSGFADPLEWSIAQRCSLVPWLGGTYQDILNGT